MKIYDGGSNIDELIIFNSDVLSSTGNSVPSPVISRGNQIFIIFNTNGKAVGKGFTAKISFGIESLPYFCHYNPGVLILIFLKLQVQGVL